MRKLTTIATLPAIQSADIGEAFKCTHGIVVNEPEGWVHIIDGEPIQKTEAEVLALAEEDLAWGASAVGDNWVEKMLGELDEMGVIA